MLPACSREARHENTGLAPSATSISVAPPRASRPASAKQPICAGPTGEEHFT
jgi:hypothetical protein